MKYPIILQFLIVSISTMVNAFDAKITILPDTIVEVGDEVSFSGSLSTGLNDPFTCKYEWSFGDGYALKRGYPNSSSAYTGANCTHFFMKPGKFTTNLIITQADSSKDSTQKTIVVQGESPISGFEIWRAPFHCRIAQYLNIQIPEDISLNKSNSLRIRLIKDKKDTTVLSNKTGINKEEKILFKNHELKSGEYELLVELLNGNSRISYLKEKFSKKYDGVPRIGINEHNAICINGNPIFLVTPWILNKGDIPIWNKKYINTVYGEGYYATHDASTWIDYLDNCKNSGTRAIGPGRWDGVGPKNLERNSDITKIEEYVNAAKENDGLMMWMWDDEPNMGGRGGRNPAPVLASWTYMCHYLDQQHPVAANLYGFPYLPYYNNNGDDYDYLNNAELFGGKKHSILDVIGFDIYPLQATEHASLKGRRIISDYVEAIDFIQHQYYGLLPVMSFIEVQKLKESPICPSYEQIIMLAWLNVIHGMKGINWFHYFGDTPQQSLDAMESFYKQITKYSGIILSPPNSRQVTDDANEPGKRVDFMVREKANNSDTTIYLFAVRLTEPDTGEDNYSILAKESDSLIVKFTIPSITDGKIISELDNRMITIINGVFQDTFKKCEVKIYRLGADKLSNKNTSIKANSQKKTFVKIPGFKTSLAIHTSNISKYINIFSVNGALVERIPSDREFFTSKKMNRNGLYIIGSGDCQNGKKAILTR